MRLSLEKAEKF